MSKVVTPAHTFGGLSSPVPMSYLDNNSTVITDAFGNQNVFSNYLLDSGAANAYAVTLAAGITGTVTDGLTIQVKVSNTNTGSSTLNYNGTGAIIITNLSGQSLSSGQMGTGTIVQLVYSSSAGSWLLQTASEPYSAWTPNIGGSATYTNQLGIFKRSTNMISASCRLDINAIGTGSTTTISGLPSPGANATMPYGGSCYYWTGLAIAPVFISPIVSGQTITFNAATAAAATLTPNAAIFQTGAGVYLNVTYFE